MKRQYFIAGGIVFLFAALFNSGMAKPLPEWPASISGYANMLYPDPAAPDFRYDKDSLPAVFAERHADLADGGLRNEAIRRFPLFELPRAKQEWEKQRLQLRKKIVEQTGAVLRQPDLPLELTETGSAQMDGYRVCNIAYQSRSGVLVTANLYIPDGNGPFPAVIVMMGHSQIGRFYDKYQSVGHSLAADGYVALCVDPWGAGERTTAHHEYEDHGDENNLGFALMNIGETLMGMQITDNIRGVDLLCSLPYVDKQRIGAAGASGGGNQTMWLTAMDERVRAAVPVVSVGTFESYIMGSPCICEVVIDGMTFTEEAAILALIAPRALLMCNHSKDNNQAFYPREMKRSYKNALPVFKMYGVEKNIAYQVFDMPHAYEKEDREATLGWFNLHLKGIGDGTAARERPYTLLPQSQLMTYAPGARDPRVATTLSFSKKRGVELRQTLLAAKSIDAGAKRKALGAMLRIGEANAKHTYELPSVNGWKRIVLETPDNRLVPVVLKTPSAQTRSFVIFSHPGGKQAVSGELIKQALDKGNGVAVVDLFGTGEAASFSPADHDSVGSLRTVSKSVLWLGKTMMGEWVGDLSLTAKFLRSAYGARQISIDASKDAGLAALFLGALEQNTIERLTLRNTPVSYLFDQREGIEFFSTAIHVFGMLKWGDVSLAAALNDHDVLFVDPTTMSGQRLSAGKLSAYQAEFDDLKKRCGQTGRTRLQ